MIDLKSIKFAAARAREVDLEDALEALRALVNESIEIVSLTQEESEFTIDFVAEDVAEDAATEEVLFAIGRVFHLPAVVN